MIYLNLSTHTHTHTLVPLHTHTPFGHMCFFIFIRRELGGKNVCFQNRGWGVMVFGQEWQLWNEGISHSPTHHMHHWWWGGGRGGYKAVERWGLGSVRKSTWGKAEVKGTRLWGVCACLCVWRGRGSWKDCIWSMFLGKVGGPLLSLYPVWCLSEDATPSEGPTSLHTLTHNFQSGNTSRHLEIEDHELSLFFTSLAHTHTIHIMQWRVRGFAYSLTLPNSRQQSTFGLLTQQLPCRDDWGIPNCIYHRWQTVLIHFMPL